MLRLEMMIHVALARSRVRACRVGALNLRAMGLLVGEVRLRVVVDREPEVGVATDEPEAEARQAVVEVSYPRSTPGCRWRA